VHRCLSRRAAPGGVAISPATCAIGLAEDHHSRAGRPRDARASKSTLRSQIAESAPCERVCEQCKTSHSRHYAGGLLRADRRRNDVGVVATAAGPCPGMGYLSGHFHRAGLAAAPSGADCSSAGQWFSAVRMRFRLRDLSAASAMAVRSLCLWTARASKGYDRRWAPPGIAVGESGGPAPDALHVRLAAIGPLLPVLVDAHSTAPVPGHGPYCAPGARGGRSALVVREHRATRCGAFDRSTK
jgi:hypothetical protein